MTSTEKLHELTEILELKEEISLLAEKLRLKNDKTKNESPYLNLTQIPPINLPAN